MADGAEADTQERSLTFGERAVGLTFNPSGSEDVRRLKELYAEVIDALNTGRARAPDEAAKRLYSVAITEAQGAQMWAVKAVTWV